MERYSAWRDNSTGILPFVSPVHAASDASNIGLYLVYPFRIVLASIRTLLFAILLGARWLLQALIAIILIFVPPISKLVQDFVTMVFLRTALCVCFGYYWIQEESTTSLRRATSSMRASTLNQYRLKPQAKDLLLVNWSSVVDVLWLSYKYQPLFVLPNVQPEGQGPAPGSRTATPTFRVVSLFEALRVTGQTPSSYSHKTQGQTLEAILQDAKRPVVLFPEGTTSNNRGLLRFSSLRPLQNTPDATRVYLVGIRHDAPTSLVPTATCPIPDKSYNPLGHLFRIFTTPLFPPRTLTIKVLVPPENTKTVTNTASELPLPSSNEFWTSASSTLGTIGKLKLMNIGWEEKDGFLEYYHRKSGSGGASLSGKASGANTPVKGRAVTPKRR